MAYFDTGSRTLVEIRPSGLYADQLSAGFTIRSCKYILVNIDTTTFSGHLAFQRSALKLNFGRLPRSEDRIKAVNEISSLQAAILSSQLKDLLWNLDSMDMLHGTCRPIKVVYYPQEPFFVSRRPEKITAIFPMRFKDNSDVVLATSFFQELMDLGDSASFSKAPHCTWSPIPPSELRGENFQYLTTNGGFVSFGMYSISQIKRLRSRIKIKGLNRLRRRWFRVPKFPALRKYSKLD